MEPLLNSQHSFPGFLQPTPPVEDQTTGIAPGDSFIWKIYMEFLLRAKYCAEYFSELRMTRRSCNTCKQKY